MRDRFWGAVWLAVFLAAQAGCGGSGSSNGASGGAGGHSSGSGGAKGAPAEPAAARAWEAPKRKADGQQAEGAKAGMNQPAVAAEAAGCPARAGFWEALVARGLAPVRAGSAAEAAGTAADREGTVAPPAAPRVMPAWRVRAGAGARAAWAVELARSARAAA